jgi:hypothetical protein
VKKGKPLASTRVLVASALAAFALTGCINLGHDSDRNSPDSQTDRFRSILRDLPAGKHLYWLGPRVAGYRLYESTLPMNVNHGVRLTYRSRAGASLSVVTHLQRSRPPGSYDVDGEFDERVTDSGQLVRVGASDGVPLTEQEERRILSALSIVSALDIDALPPYWVEIP